MAKKEQLESLIETEREDEQEEELTTSGPSALAQEIARLKSATVNAAAKRERLPQPLFWSLFNAELAEIRRKKELRRVLDSVLSPSVDSNTEE